MGELAAAHDGGGYCRDEREELHLVRVTRAG